MGTWKYDPFLRLPLLSIATLLNQLKVTDLTNKINIENDPPVSPVLETSSLSSNLNVKTITTQSYEIPVSDTTSRSINTDKTDSSPNMTLLKKLMQSPKNRRPKRW